MKFEEALKLNNLGTRIEEQYGRWGHFKEENVKTVISIVTLESEKSLVTSVSTMAMVAFTWSQESTWSFSPVPNTNNKPTSPWNWDVGPFQLNLGWTVRMSWQGDFLTKDLNWRGVWGESFFEADGVTPAGFNGNVIENGRCALRRILSDNRNDPSFKDKEMMRMVLYTGPKAQPARLKAWNEYGEDFKRFFDLYLTN